MLKKRYDLWEAGEYTYPMAFGFQPNIVSYLHEDTEKARPCVIVVPGGGYRVVSPSEGEIVAKKFYDKGYQTFVCTAERSAGKRFGESSALYKKKCRFIRR